MAPDLPNISPDSSVHHALEVYLAENGFTEEAYSARWTEASFLGIPIRVPNTKLHAWAIRLHDLHHIATGYGTDLVGEGEISAFELRNARTTGLYVASIIALGALTGLAFSPQRVLRAYRAGEATSRLFTREPDMDAYQRVLELTVAELRARLCIARDGLADLPRRLHTYAPRASAHEPLSASTRSTA